METKPSRAPNRAGTITRYGYRQHGRVIDGKLVFMFEHRMVWEAAHGPIPDGHQIHHVNGDKLDNRLANLECLTPLEHSRRHHGFEMRDGVLCKPCTKCKVILPVEDGFYKSGPGFHGKCKSCSNAIRVMDRRRQKERQAMAKRQESLVSSQPR